MVKQQVYQQRPPLLPVRAPATREHGPELPTKLLCRTRESKDEFKGGGGGKMKLLNQDWDFQAKSAD